MGDFSATRCGGFFGKITLFPGRENIPEKKTGGTPERLPPVEKKSQTVRS